MPSSGEKYGVYPLELLRGDEHMWSPRSQQLASGDVLLMRGDWDKIEDFRKSAELEIAPEAPLWQDGDEPRVLVEVMVAPASHAGRPQPQRARFPVALRRERAGHPSARPHPARKDQDRAARSRRRAADAGRRGRRCPSCAATIASSCSANARNRADAAARAGRDRDHGSAVVVASGLHWLPIPVAAICGAIAMALGRLLRPQGRLRRRWTGRSSSCSARSCRWASRSRRPGCPHVVVDAGMGLVGDHGPLDGAAAWCTC